VKRITTLLIASFLLCHGYAQSDNEKNVQLSFVASFDYSYNYHPIQTNYITIFGAPGLPVIHTLTVVGKPAFGEGMRIEFNCKNKICYTISCMMLDKGYSIKYESSANNTVYQTRFNNYGRVYFSIPMELIYKIGSSDGPMFLKSGISLDFNLEYFTRYRPFAASFIIGAGRAFSINEMLRLTIEPTIRFAMFDYGEHLQIGPYNNYSYRPVSAGFILSLSQ